MNIMFNNFPGRDTGCLFVFHYNRNGTAVVGETSGRKVDHNETVWIEPTKLQLHRPVFSCVHHAAVFLLHGLAQGGRIADQPIRRGRR